MTGKLVSIGNPALPHGRASETNYMETNTQRLIHAFSALADLGQEIADAGDFEDMLRNSFHLLLGSLAIRRGAVDWHSPLPIPRATCARVRCAGQERLLPWRLKVEPG